MQYKVAVKGSLLFNKCYGGGMKFVGEVFPTEKYGNLIITEYVNCYEVYVKFLETGYETKSRLGDIKRGKVKDRFSPSVCGVGIVGNEITHDNNVALKEYYLWHNMLVRCYGERLHKKYPTYLNCSASENFKHYPYFKEWCNNQVGFGNEGWTLDKDILVKGNKLYSEDTCCFVPSEINKLFVKNDAKRGECPIGVSRRRKAFLATIKVAGKKVNLGIHSTKEIAFQAYKEAKENYIKDVANKWKGQLDERVYESLMNYEVEIDD